MFKGLHQIDLNTIYTFGMSGHALLTTWIFNLFLLKIKEETIRAVWILFSFGLDLYLSPENITWHVTTY